MSEDYSNARTLATVEHLGVTFRICRRRVNGKPWRKYLALVHVNAHVAADYDLYPITDVDAFKAWAVQNLDYAFPSSAPDSKKKMSDRIIAMETAND